MKNNAKIDSSKEVQKKCDHIIEVPRPKTSKKNNQHNAVVLNEDEETELQRAFRRDKLLKLKKKETDEWALIAKYNHYKACVEKKNQLIKEKEKREGFTGTLQKQKSEKAIAKRNLDSMEEKFFEEQKESLKKHEDKEKRDKEEKTKKIMQDKELREMYDKVNKDQKNKRRNEEKEVEKAVIEVVKNEIKVEEEKKNEKKYKGQERLQEIIKENNEKIERKQKQKEEEKKTQSKVL